MRKRRRSLPRVNQRLIVSMIGLACFLIAAAAFAGKIPLRPEELVAEADTIVTAKVEQVTQETHVEKDGSKIIEVTLALSVVEAEKSPQPMPVGERLTARCWQVVREPLRGIVWDSGHWNIPDHGATAKFFLTNGDVIYPNGLEVPGGSPILQLLREPKWHAYLEPPRRGRIVALVLTLLSAIVVVAYVVIHRWRLGASVLRKRNELS